VQQRGIVKSISIAQVGRYLLHAALSRIVEDVGLNTTEKNADNHRARGAIWCAKRILEASHQAANNGTTSVER